MLHRMGVPASPRAATAFASDASVDNSWMLVMPKRSARPERRRKAATAASVPSASANRRDATTPAYSSTRPERSPSSRRKNPPGKSGASSAKPTSSIAGVLRISPWPVQPQRNTG